jgi:cytoskeletal protein CcmA (bactofilin family)
MARHDNTGMIDGYMAVQTVRRSSGKQHEPDSTDAPRTDVSGNPDTPAPAAGTKPHGFGHTALPTRHDIRCYACGYQFVVTGRPEKILCPKCKEQLHTGDKTICGPFTGTIQTVGTVTIHSGAVVTDSDITASVLRIAGICRKSRLTPGIRVELETGVEVDSAQLDSVDVVVAKGQEVSLNTELHCKTLNLEGKLHAQVRAGTGVTLQEGSTFRGRIHAPSLVVADGAALHADLHIKPSTGEKQTGPIRKPR